MITVLGPGLLTTVQDGGRSGFAHLGVPRAGAVDILSLGHANLLVANGPQTAALEATLVGPALRFEVDTVVAFAGGTVEARLDEMPVPMYQSVMLKAGQMLRCGALLTGMRSYLAVAGGIQARAVFGSTSTDTLADLGPAVLRAGDQLPIHASPLPQGFYFRSPPTFMGEATLRVMAGPHEDWFTPRALRDFLAGRFAVRADSDRIGVRLAGPRITRQRREELDSQGMLTGAVQVPPDGQPIVLLSNHGTTGGYPVIATVISADLPRLGQLRPGAQVNFQAVSREQALSLWRAEQEKWRTALVPADAGLLAARALMMLAKANPVLREVRLHQGPQHMRIRCGIC